jgi:ferrous iron transport protein B
VIDSWKQRLLTIAISWVVPCIPVWAVVGVMGSIFFGFRVIWVVISLFVAAALHMFITSLIFGRSFSSPEDRTGLIMELPPYHRPNKRTLLRFVWYRMKDVLLRATKLITLVSVAFWLLSYSKNGDITSTVLYRAGVFIEPVTLFFGLNWELFTAFVVSTLGKEASLGVISALFNTAGGTVNLFELGMGGDSTVQLTAALLTKVSQPQALAFIFGVFFTVPCIAALGATAAETHSVKWTARMALYYVGVAFVMMGIAYRVGLVIL